MQSNKSKFINHLITHNNKNNNNKNDNKFTANGAKTFGFCDGSADAETVSREGRMALFYHAIRGVDQNRLKEMLNQALSEDPVMTIQILFYIRDCRGGKGERQIARDSFNHIVSNFNSCIDTKTDTKTYSKLLYSLLSEIPEYGRWDDLIDLYLLSKNDEICRIVWNKLESDLELMNSGSPCSLLAKWIPTEGKKLDTTTSFVKYFVKWVRKNTHLKNFNKKMYRTRYLSPLRKYTDVVESKVCAGLWTNIDYNKVPSCTMHKLKGAFARHDTIRFDEWKSGLASGVTKVNSGQLFPHEIVKECLRTPSDGTLLNAQWRNLVEKTRSFGLFANSIVICDVSSSMMTGRTMVIPMHVSIALSLLISEITSEPYKNTVITFSDEPQFVQLKSKTIVDQVKEISKIEWGRNTDLQNVFDLLLQNAVKNGLKPDEIPDRLYIISDMQFDEACYSNDKTNFECAKSNFNQAGYNLPHVVFWNVNGSDDFPVQVDESGTILISGYSQDIMKYILQDESIPTPWDVVLKTVSDPRYDRLREFMLKV